MANSFLNPKVLAKLVKKLKSKKTENAIRSKLSRIRSEHHITLNAAAEVLANEHGFNVTGLLNKEDMDCLKDKDIKKNTIDISPRKNSQKKIKIFVKYVTDDIFLTKHLDEINKCYTYGCYTAAFIVCRKVIENLIVAMIKKKFPGRSKAEKELYLDFTKGRILDLSVLLKNLNDKSSQFDPDEKKLVQRIVQKSEGFKEDANDKTHSLYHISSKKELDEKDPQEVLDLIGNLFRNY